MTSPVVYVNGRFVPQAEARVSVLDRGFLYGDGVFETLRAYRGRIFRLLDHLERLQRSAEQIHLSVPESMGTLETLLYEVLKRNGLADAILRLALTRGESGGGFEMAPDALPTLVISARPAEPLAETLYREGVAVALIPDSAPHLPGAATQVKSANFLPYILARKMAQDRDCWDGILLNPQGGLCDTSTSNVFLVHEGVLKTPALNEYVLAGITRKVVLELARRLGISTLEMPLGADDLHQADEAFLTNTGIELLPVTRVDTHPIGSGRPGPMTEKLHREFLKSIESL
ncbi:aminotransferase class IV [Nitrospina watsonii]|uniref:branched-chain-amino-acid transaminase n=1 Tax=Nitrospina watsonii TaxID=1323948 RepID=A0ABN8VXE0_9BACT|nr:aminotransferase class IV [Nitrospina watsonii]CAI2718325.1 Branched-chain amino acid aminotransferase [Nitrospina watsonii]